MSAIRIAKEKAEVKRLKAVLDKLVPLANEVMDAHRNPGSTDYNECEIVPCHWCKQAREAMGGLNGNN